MLGNFLNGYAFWLLLGLALVLTRQPSRHTGVRAGR